MMESARNRIATCQLRMQVPGLPAVDLRDDWHGEGYGVGNEKTADAVQRAAGNGIALEQTHSGKAFAAFSDRLATTRQPVLFWNTYGSRSLPREIAA